MKTDRNSPFDENPIRNCSALLINTINDCYNNVSIINNDKEKAKIKLNEEIN